MIVPALKLAVLNLALLSLTMIIAPGCSVEPDESKVVETTPPEELKGDIAVRDTTILNSGEATGSTSQSELSLALFKEHIFPILKKNCASCHGSTAAPVFAQEDELASFQALVNANKVNFDNPIQSRLVLRMSQDLHNCWSDCSENATVLKSAIDNWKAGLASGSAGTGKAFPFVTAEQSVNKVITIKTTDPSIPGVIVFEAESTILKTPFEATTDAAASGGKIVSSATGGTAPAGLADTVVDPSTLGNFTIDFEVGEDGYYQVFAQVRAANNNENTVYFKMNDETLRTWDIGTTGVLDWRTLSQTEAPAGAVKFDLKKGANKLIIYQAEDNIAFDKFIITNRTLGDLDDYEVSPLNNAALIYSLKEIIGLDVSLAIAIEKLDDKTYLFRSPVLINQSGKTITIKGVYPLLNGVWSEQNATYSKSKVTTAERVTALSTAAMTVVADKGYDIDKLTLGIDELKIVD